MIKTVITLTSQQICFLGLKDNLDRLKEVVHKNFLFLEDHLTELSKLAFVAIVTTFSRQQNFYESRQFRLMHL